MLSRVSSRSLASAGRAPCTHGATRACAARRAHELDSRWPSAFVLYRCCSGSGAAHSLSGRQYLSNRRLVLRALLEALMSTGLVTPKSGCKRPTALCLRGLCSVLPQRASPVSAQAPGPSCSIDADTAPAAPGTRPHSSRLRRTLSLSTGRRRAPTIGVSCLSLLRQFGAGHQAQIRLARATTLTCQGAHGAGCPLQDFFVVLTA